MAGTANDRDLTRYLDALSEESDTRRDDTGAKDADLNLRFLRGQTQPSEVLAGAGRRSETNAYAFSMNVLKTMVARKVSLITDSRPEITVMSRASREWQQAADGYKDVCAAIWDLESMDQKSARELVRAAVVGVSCGLPVWDAAADYGRGAVRLLFYGPNQIAFDPSITQASSLKDAEYFQVREVIPLNRIREMFPSRGGEVQPSAHWSSYEPHRKRGTGSGTILSAMARPYRRDNSEVIDSATPRAEMRHSWFRDFARDQRGQPIYSQPRMLRHTVDASDVILMDEAMVYQHQSIPAHLLDWGVELEHPWGLSEVSGLRRIQYTLNRIVGQIMDNVLITNKVRVLSDTDAVDPKTWDAITSNPNGIYIRKRSGRQFDYQMPQQAIPPFILDFVNLLIQSVDMVSGLYDASQGRGSASGASGVAIEGLQTAAQSIVRMEARAFEDFLERLFQQVISLIAQYMTTDRVFHILGPGGNFRAFEFHRQQLIRSDTHEVLPPEAWQDFQFRILPGTSLSSTRIQRGIMAMNLHKAGLLPGVEVLRAAEWPDPEGTMQAAVAEQAAHAQAAQAIAGGPAGAPPGPGALGGGPARPHRATQAPIPMPGVGRRTQIP
jgi:hypothetical protein